MAGEPTTDIPDITTLSNATSGDGTLLYVSLDGTTWTEVAELDDEDGLTDLPSGDQTTYETTHMGSGDFKEFKKNRRREGAETDITGNYEIGSANETTLESLDNSTAAVPYNIVLKQGADVYDATGTALFYNLRRSNPGGDVRQFTITAKWVSKMTVAKRGAE